MIHVLNLRHLFIRLCAPLGVLLLLVALSSCDNKGLVGSDIFPDRTQIRVDTFNLPNFEIREIPSFSGNLNGFTAGIYADPKFGEIYATSIFKTRLINPILMDQFDDNSSLQIVLKIASITGDTTAPADFDLFRAGRNWRGNNWRRDSVMTEGDFLNSFTVPPSVDSVVVTLPKFYTDFYMNITAIGLIRSVQEADSIFRAQDFGFLVVPRSINKLVTFSDFGSYLFADVNDSTKRGTEFRSIGYSLSRQNTPSVDQDQAMMISDFSITQKFKVTISKEGGTTINGVPYSATAIARAELVFYEDSVAMQTGLPPGHVRDRTNFMSFFTGNDQSIRFNILSNPFTTALRRREDGSYRVNITNYIQQRIIRNQGVDEEFYINYGLNDGGFTGLIIHSHLHPTRNPKLIITSVAPVE